MSLISTVIGRQDEPGDLGDIIAQLPHVSAAASFGEDISKANEILLSEAPEETKRATLFRWIGRWQPCLFGRLSAHHAKGEAASKGLRAYLCWIHDWEIGRGSDYVSAKIQRERRAWKDIAEQGRASGFLIMFNSAELASAAPSKELVEVCQVLSGLYLIEHAPIQADVIYTEAVPLRASDGQLALYKAGCNIFYTAAHRTRNHDRRVPGGLMFSVNSPGHYANSLTLRGIYPDFGGAVQFVRETAYRSIGNGGHGHPGLRSASWHNRTGAADGCPARKLPSYVPEDFDPSRYSATYHTDVLVPADVTIDGHVFHESYEDAEVWPYLILDYISADPFPADHPNYGLFHGYPIDDCGKYHNPWPPLAARNDASFEY